MGHYFYFTILGISFTVPFLLSFKREVSFYKQWKYLFPAILISALPFLIWDYFFTKAGIWGFNPEYISGIYLANLPLEEVLFFLLIPYCCLFIYEVTKHYHKEQPFHKFQQTIGAFGALSLIALSFMFSVKAYTMSAFLSSGIMLGFNYFFGRRYMGRFYLTYLISLMPFILVNGALTGSITPHPVVWYNNDENLGIRIISIPFEDMFYGLALLLLNTSLYEFFKQRALSSDEHH